jgi:hypothetical protein
MRKIGVGTALALAGCVALAAGAIALATGAANGDSVTQVADSNDDNDSGSGRGRDHGFLPRLHRPSAKEVLERREEYAKALGEELDRSTDEVLDALRNVFKSRLDEAVEEENLTQKQADRILECYDKPNECKPPRLTFRRGHGPGMPGPPPGPIGPPPFGP